MYKCMFNKWYYVEFQVTVMLGGRNLKSPGWNVGRCGGFASKLMPHIWGIVPVKLDKSAPLAPYASGWGGAYN